VISIVLPLARTPRRAGARPAVTTAGEADVAGGEIPSSSAIELSRRRRAGRARGAADIHRPERTSDAA
jgi:hypothetical protein